MSHNLLLPVVNKLNAASATPLFPCHPASLLPVSEHDPRLLQYLGSYPDIQLVSELVTATERVVWVSLGSPSPSAHEQNQALSLHPQRKEFKEFVLCTIVKAKSRVGELAYALLILDRLGRKLMPASRGKLIDSLRYSLVH